ncbi:hypothetical protein EN780_03275 [Mesorhizobium sp. M4B.F.Ca.ET.089.01.1.1]|uniref:hypothetical protein n=1 Tax=Mesorhizobium sp. M4B.F.Ca.ET.089.01.1.1 TaxID=2496662 RepID=UPI000FE2E9F4|nr:hypothetical protein [Mesorhizobium sp. M4B.F.Ca.ET.089.01.1.1]RWX70429.1 hypothetical protein EN780_03275 [Mesorhizobium sp. M4B.F.Ca.ET.089.01.1.1]
MAALIAFATANPQAAVNIILLGLIGLCGLIMLGCYVAHVTAADRRRNRSDRRRAKRRAANLAAFRRRVAI